MAAGHSVLDGGRRALDCLRHLVSGLLDGAGGAVLLLLRAVGRSSGGVGRGGAGGVLDGLRGVLRMALRTHTWIIMDEP